MQDDLKALYEHALERVSTDSSTLAKKKRDQLLKFDPCNCPGQKRYQLMKLIRTIFANYGVDLNLI